MTTTDTFAADLIERLGKATITSFDEYDVIGFDVDHCLAQYNVPNLHAMTYRALTNTLVKEFSYPPSIQQVTPETLNFPINGLICDKKTGCLLKLGENNRILRAYYGLEALPDKDVEDLYGSPPILSAFDKAIIGTDFAVTMTYFDTAFVLAFAASIESVKRKEFSKAPLEVFADIVTAIKKNYIYWNPETKEMKPLASYEGFYPNIVKDPQLFVRKRDNVAAVLRELKKRGKALFLASNSCYDFCDLIMTAAYGPDWRKLFDLCITGSGKPDFFVADKSPFLKADTAKFLFMGEAVKGPLEIGGEYVKGNYKDVERTFESYLNKKGLRFLYVGDHYLNDCYCTKTLKDWDCVAIVEELSYELGMGSNKAELLNYKPYWGSHFYEILPDGTKHLTLWASLFLKELKGILPGLDYLVSTYCP